MYLLISQFISERYNRLQHRPLNVPYDSYTDPYTECQYSCLSSVAVVHQSHWCLCTSI